MPRERSSERRTRACSRSHLSLPLRGAGRVRDRRCARPREGDIAGISRCPRPGQGGRWRLCRRHPDESVAPLAQIALVQARDGDKAGARATLQERSDRREVERRNNGILYERLRRVLDASAKEIGDVEGASATAEVKESSSREPLLWQAFPAPRPNPATLPPRGRPCKKHNGSPARVPSRT